jgi:hypothetical protein
MALEDPQHPSLFFTLQTLFLTDRPMPTDACISPCKLSFSPGAEALAGVGCVTNTVGLEFGLFTVK